MKKILVSALLVLFSGVSLAAHEGWLVTMSPSQEIETPTVAGTNASCYASFVMTTPNRLRYKLNCLGLEDITGAHIHGPADADNNGPVVIGLFSNPSGTGPVAGKVVTDVIVRSEVGTETFDAVLDVLGGDKGYVNVHTLADPAGAVRGQIIPVSVPDAPYLPF